MDILCILILTIITCLLHSGYIRDDHFLDNDVSNINPLNIIVTYDLTPNFALKIETMEEMIPGSGEFEPGPEFRGKNATKDDKKNTTSSKGSDGKKKKPDYKKLLNISKWKPIGFPAAIKISDASSFRSRQVGTR